MLRSAATLLVEDRSEVGKEARERVEEHQTHKYQYPRRHCGSVKSADCYEEGKDGKLDSTVFGNPACLHLCWLALFDEILALRSSVWLLSEDGGCHPVKL